MKYEVTANIEALSAWARTDLVCSKEYLLVGSVAEFVHQIASVKNFPDNLALNLLKNGFGGSASIKHKRILRNNRGRFDGVDTTLFLMFTDLW